MRNELLLSGVDADPAIKQVDQCLPGVNKQFAAMGQLIRTTHEAQTQRVDELAQQMDDIPAQMTTTIRENLANMLRGAGEAVAIGGSPINDNRQLPEQHDNLQTETETQPLEETTSEQKLMPYMRFGVTSISNLFDEFKGIGNYNGIPIDGGYCKLEEENGTKWRKHFKSADQKWFSRALSVVRAIDMEHERSGDDLNVVLARFQDWFVQCNNALGSLVEKLQMEGLIVKRGSRKRKAHGGEEQR